MSPKPRSSRQRIDAGVLCPVCESPQSISVDSRPGQGYYRRRRQCTNGHRFTTHERVVKAKATSLDQTIKRAIMRRLSEVLQ